MGVTVANPSGVATVFAEVALAAAQAEGEAEELALLQEMAETATLEQQGKAQGQLKGEKSYTFIPQSMTEQGEKLSDYLKQTAPPAEKKFAETKHSSLAASFKENPLKQKEFKQLESAKSFAKESEGRSSTESKKETPQKSAEAARQTLKESASQQTFLRGQPPALQQQAHQTRNLEQRVHQEFNRHEEHEESRESGRKFADPRDRAREAQQAESQRLEQKEESQKEKNQERDRQEEDEGFAGGGNSQQDQDCPEEEKNPSRVEKTPAEFAKEFSQYAAEESILSQILGMRVSQFDVIVLFIEILKLEIKSREQERISRSLEREMQLMHMQKVVDNYKSQGNWAMIGGIGAGVLGIISGLSPVVGFMKGSWLIEKLSTVFSSIEGMKQKQLFESISKVTYAMAEMQKAMGQIHTLFSEGTRNRDQLLSQLHGEDASEITRSIEEIKDSWKGIENFIYQTLQMQHDAIRQLYSRST